MSEVSEGLVGAWVWDASSAYEKVVGTWMGKNIEQEGGVSWGEARIRRGGKMGGGGVTEGEVVVEAPSPGYNCKVIEGVFLGIAGMFDVEGGSVEQTKCVKNGDDTCEYTIKW